MRRLFNLLMIPLLLSFSCCAEREIDKDKETVVLHDLLGSFQDALEASDRETMKSLTTDDFLAFDSGRSLYIEDLETGIDYYIEIGMTDLQQATEIIRSEVYPGNAVLYYLNTLTGKMNGRDIKAAYTGSCFFVNQEGSWKIKYLHTELPVFWGAPPGTTKQ